ncbi:hypothetical protein C8R44DRAFT_624729 [Mycena epipterygia]|nr:hypothetical protein C8R44DRAFT_624729 [Mycena epipterygia]
MPLAPPALSVAQRPYQHYPLSPVPSESQCACADGACLNALAGPSSLRPLRRHVCPTCSKTFTTNGHLRRHARIHTGEKHACPFPGCHKMCSRQDNLQQQCVSFNGRYYCIRTDKCRQLQKPPGLLLSQIEQEQGQSIAVAGNAFRGGADV